MKVLAGMIRPYAWGSRTAIAELQGRPSPMRRNSAGLRTPPPQTSSRCVSG